MRSAGFAVLTVFIGVATTLAQPPSGPAVPPPLPPAVAAPDLKLDGHLASWEKTMTSLTNFRFELALKRADPAAGIFKGEKEFKGEVLCMKPNFARLRLVYAADPKDYEAFICNGKAVYAYNGLQKTITEHKMPDPKANPNGGTDNLILDFVSGMKAKQLKDRFEIKLFKEDEHYIYLDIKPVLGKDKQEFQQLRLALYGPKTGELAYLPAQVYTVKPNGETEQWKMTEPKVNIQGITEKVFQYENVPGFRFQKAPDPGAGPAVRPGQPTPPVKRGP